MQDLAKANITAKSGLKFFHTSQLIPKLTVSLKSDLRLVLSSGGSILPTLVKTPINFEILTKFCKGICVFSCLFGQIIENNY